MRTMSFGDFRLPWDYFLTCIFSLWAVIFLSQILSLLQTLPQNKTTTDYFWLFVTPSDHLALASAFERETQGN